MLWAKWRFESSSTDPAPGRVNPSVDHVVGILQLGAAALCNCSVEMAYAEPEGLVTAEDLQVEVSGEVSVVKTSYIRERKS